MTSLTASPPDRLALDVPDDTLAELAEDFLDAMLGAASVDVIGVSSWWPRATSALTAASARATSVRDVVTVMTGKLQIETIPESTARQVARAEALLADPVVFARWRRIAERDAVYVAGMVRLRRVDKRDARKAQRQDKPTTQPVATVAATSEEPMF